MPYTLPKLDYEFNGLEPIMPKELLELHYSKHHQAYINNLNTLLEKYKEAKGKNDLITMTDLLANIKFNSGGHLNHTLFWECLTPQNKSTPNGKIISKIEEDFSSFDAFKEKFTKMAINITGSGWAWLLYNLDTQHLQLATTQNHDRCDITLKPLLILDVWEHAYYLKYKNVRADFVKDIWKIFNWQKINDSYLACL
jgi:Fe-Mn family superoxide dismutase